MPALLREGMAKTIKESEINQEKVNKTINEYVDRLAQLRSENNLFRLVLADYKKWLA